VENQDSTNSRDCDQSQKPFQPYQILASGIKEGIEKDRGKEQISELIGQAFLVLHAGYATAKNPILETGTELGKAGH
jgi:hypothetical protein